LQERWQGRQGIYDEKGKPVSAKAAIRVKEQSSCCINSSSSSRKKRSGGARSDSASAPKISALTKKVRYDANRIRSVDSLNEIENLVSNLSSDSKFNDSYGSEKKRIDGPENDLDMGDGLFGL